MINPSTLETLIGLAAKEVEKAAVVLGHTMRACAETEQRLALLIQYREDYVERFQQNRKAGLSVLDYRNYLNFIDKLDEAITAQQQIVTQAKERVEEARAVWQECEKKKSSYETLQERERIRQIKKENRREQKEADEFNSRKARMDRLKQP